MFYLVQRQTGVGILSLGKDLTEQEKTTALTDYVYKEVENLPDTSYQSAWQCNWEDPEDTTVSIEMVKAREVYRDKIRPERDLLLRKMDVQFMLALEQGDSVKQTEVATDKQYLRDVTGLQDIEDCISLAELEALDLLAIVRNKV